MLSYPKPLITGLCVIGLTVGLASAQVVIEQESFESAGGDYGFSVSPAFTGSGTGDYWDRISNNGSRSAFGTFGNALGSFVVASSSSPGAPAGGFAVTMDAVNITGFVNTKVRVRVAAPGGSAQYDSLDFLWIEANVDGAGWTPVARFESTDNAGNNFNQSLSLDSDANGNGDGVVVLGLNFLDLEFPISTGSSVQVRARMPGNNNNEPMAVDDFRVMGEVPTTNPPVLAGVPAGALAYVEGDGPVELAPALTATDNDSNITIATVAISSNYNSGEDTLVFTPLGNGVTVLSNTGGADADRGSRARFLPI